MKKRKNSEMGERANLRLPVELMAEVRTQAARLGLHISAYVRMAVAERIARDRKAGKAEAR